MNRRLLKLHRCQVSRANERVMLSEPDVRTPEEFRAARQASRPAGGWRNPGGALYSTPSIPYHAGPSSGSTAKGEG